MVPFIPIPGQWVVILPCFYTSITFVIYGSLILPPWLNLFQMLFNTQISVAIYFSHVFSWASKAVFNQLMASHLRTNLISFHSYVETYSFVIILLKCSPITLHYLLNFISKDMVIQPLPGTTIA